MRTYHVDRGHDDFQVIEISDGVESIINGFATPEAAEAWLDRYLRMLNMVRLVGWATTTLDR